MGIVLLGLILLSNPVWANSEYVVKPGDSLSKIAQELCNDGGKWPEIYRANKDVISDADSLRIGWVLTIPCGEEIPEMWLVTGDQYPPFTDLKAPEDGMITEIVKLVFEEMGYEDIPIEFLGWEEGYQATKRGKFAATFPYVETKERMEDFNYSKPLYTILTRWFVKKDAAINYTTAEDLKGLSCCKPEGYNLNDIQEFLDKGLITLKQTKEMVDCFKMLEEENVDLVPINELVGWGIVQKRFKTRELFRTLDKPVDSATLHLIVSKTYPDGVTLLERFNQAFDKLKEQEKIKKIIQKHLQYYYSQ